MLTPRYLESAPDAMVDLYSEVEADILADMARRIARYDFFIPAAEHQLRVLEEMGAEQTYILRRLAELTGRSEAELRQLFEVSGGKALVSDQADYRRAGLHPPALNTSQELQQVDKASRRILRLFYSFFHPLCRFPCRHDIAHIHFKRVQRAGCHLNKLHLGTAGLLVHIQ